MGPVWANPKETGQRTKEDAAAADAAPYMAAYRASLVEHSAEVAPNAAT